MLPCILIASFIKEGICEPAMELCPMVLADESRIFMGIKVGRMKSGT